MSSIAPILTGLTARQQRAAVLVAEDKLTDVAIARETGISKRTLETWKRRDDFRAAVELEAAALLASVRRRGIADKQNRVNSAVDRHKRLEGVIDERAEDPMVAAVPGGKSGLIVPSPVVVKVYTVRDGSDAELTPTRQSVVMHEYAIDTGMLREMRELEKQVAQELGEWSERHEHAGKGGGPIGIRHESADDDGFDWEAYGAIFAEVMGGSRAGSLSAGSADHGEPMDPGHADAEANGILDGPLP